MADVLRVVCDFLDDHKDVASVECASLGTRGAVVRAGVWGRRAYGTERGTADGNLARCKKLCMQGVTLARCFLPLRHSSPTLYTSGIDIWDRAQGKLCAEYVMSARHCFDRLFSLIAERKKMRRGHLHYHSPKPLMRPAAPRAAAGASPSHPSSGASNWVPVPVLSSVQPSTNNIMAQYPSRHAKRTKCNPPTYNPSGSTSQATPASTPPPQLHAVSSASAAVGPASASSPVPAGLGWTWLATP